jgi:hypothetical protein
LLELKAFWKGETSFGKERKEEKRVDWAIEKSSVDCWIEILWEDLPT